MAVIEAPIEEHAEEERTEVDPVTETLERMVRILDEGGWCQWDAADGFGRHCLVGAAAMATSERPSFLRPSYAVVLEQIEARVRTAVAWWNDSEGRTYEQVRGLLVELIEERRASD